MPAVVVWLDREQARIFEFSSTKMERKSLAASPDRDFFADLSALLTESSRLLLTGPGVAKHHFRNHLVEQFPLLAKRIVGVEAIDSPTDDQIAALARQVFKLSRP